MLRTSLMTTFVLGALAPSLSADEFHFRAKTEAEKTQGNAGAALEGVLLREENGNYVIRVEGGEVVVPKASVVEIVKTDLTVEVLEEREQNNRERLAEANTKRRQWQAAEAAAARDAEAAEAAASAAQAPQQIEVVVDFMGLLPNYRFKPTYDPVLHRVNLDGLARVVEAYLRGEVQRAAYRR